MTRPKTPASLAPWLLAATAVALVSGGWAAFLWQQLVLARSGGEPFCALGGGGCAALWDGPFANAIHASTGLPVAAWGVVWGGAAAGLALLAWTRTRRNETPEPIWSGVALLAAMGAASVVVLGAASAAAGELCSNCLITYALVAAYAGIVFVASAARRPVALASGAGYAAIALAGLFAMLLYPGLATPKSGARMGGAALRAAPVGSDPIVQVRAMIEDLSPRERQTLANARAEYATAKRVTGRPVRALVGPESAPLRLTTFTDSGCSHCAIFHRTLEDLLRALPEGQIAIEQRVFPLDASCNLAVPRGGRPQLCLAAQVRVCLERDPRALELAGWLHEAEPLSSESIYQLGQRLTTRASLEACIGSPDTARKLQEDIQMAHKAGLRGTPFVLANDKPAMTFAPFLYALALIGEEVDHPVFAGLPPPVAASPGHEGHAH